MDHGITGFHVPTSGVMPLPQQHVLWALLVGLRASQELSVQGLEPHDYNLQLLLQDLLIVQVQQEVGSVVIGLSQDVKSLPCLRLLCLPNSTIEPF